MIPDYLLEATLDFKFTTRAFATGIPTVLAGTPVVEIYEDNSTTQITGAETLTVDFDTVVGLNNLRVVATAANGFETGKSYTAVLSAGTVGGVSVVGEVVAEFSIERSPAFARLGAPAGASVSADIAVIEGQTDDIGVAGAGLTDLGGMSTGMKAEVNAEADTALTDYDAPTKAEMDTAHGLLATEAKQDIIDTNVDDIEADLANATDGLGALKALIDTVNTDLSNGTDGLGALKTLLDAIPTTAMRGTDSAALATEVTAARMSELDDAAGKLVAIADLIKTAADAIKLKTDNLPEGIVKNAAFSNLPFLMVLTSDHVTPATGLTVTGQRSIDGGAFAGVSGTITEVANGIYSIDLLAADTNGDTIIYRFSSATADDTFVTIKTTS